jgi:hypothetical protein
MQRSVQITYKIVIIFLIALTLALLADHTIFKTYSKTIIYETKISL